MGAARKDLNPYENETPVREVPFHGTVIYTTKVGEDVYVLFRPSVEAMGLAYSSQVKKLSESPWANRVDINTVAEDGKDRTMMAVDLDTWSMWLAGVNSNKVSPHLRELIVHYQRESAKALRQYWTQGGAVNPRAREDQLVDLKKHIENRLIEQSNYKRITSLLSRALSDLDADKQRNGYAWAQTTLYVGIFGKTAKEIIKTQKQVNGERCVRGKRKGDFTSASGLIAKNYLNAQQLDTLNNTVLAITGLLSVRFPGKHPTMGQISEVIMEVAEQARNARKQLGAAA